MWLELFLSDLSLHRWILQSQAKGLPFYQLFILIAHLMPVFFCHILQSRREKLQLPRWFFFFLM